MRWRPVPVGVLLLLIASCTRSCTCTPIPRCGDFTFTGSKVDTPEQNGIDMNVSFDFNPAACGSDCTCTPVCYIQIVRTVDMETSTYIYPSSSF